MMDSFGIFLTGILAGVGISLILVLFLPTDTHIKNFKETPYCETKHVAGAPITRCLQAVVVVNP